MYFRSLPAKITSGENKDKQAFVQITNEKLGFPKTKPLQIEQDKFEYPQFGPEPTVTKDESGKETVTALTEEQGRAGIDEFIANAGGAVAALEVINTATKTAATNEGKLYIRQQEAGDLNSIIETGLKRSHDFTWKGVEKVSNKEIVAGVKSLQANMAAMSAEEIAAEVRRILGQA